MKCYHYIHQYKSLFIIIILLFIPDTGSMDRVRRSFLDLFVLTLEVPVLSPFSLFYETHAKLSSVLFFYMRNIPTTFTPLFVTAFFDEKLTRTLRQCFLVKETMHLLLNVACLHYLRKLQLFSDLKQFVCIPCHSVHLDR